MLEILKTLAYIEFLLMVSIFIFKYIAGRRNSNTIDNRIVCLTLLTPAVAMLCGNVYILFVYLVFVIAFTARLPTSIAALYLAILPMLPSLAQETRIAGQYIGPISTIYAMNFGALLGALIAPGGSALKPKGHYYIAVICLIGIFIYIYCRHTNLTGLLRIFIFYGVNFLGPYLVILRAVNNRRDVERLMLALVYGAMTCSVVSLFQMVRHWVLYQTMYNALHVQQESVSLTLALRGGLLRTGGTMLDHSSAGVFLAVSLCIMPFLRQQFTVGRYWMLTLILVGGLFATQSRGAWLAAIGGCLFILLYRRRYGSALMIGGGVSAMFAVIMTFAKSGSLASIAGLNQEASATVDYRKDLARRGLEQIAAHPIFGQTQEQLVNNLSELEQGQHIVDFVNAHLFIAMTAGLPLLGVWLLVWGQPLVKAWQLRRLRLPNGDLAELPAAILVPATMAIVATSIVDRNLVWPTIALGLAGPCFALAGRDRKKATPQRGTPPPLSSQADIAATL